MREVHSRKRTSKYKGPEVGTGLAYSGNSKEWSELGKCGRGQVWTGEQGVRHAGIFSARILNLNFFLSTRISKKILQARVQMAWTLFKVVLRDKPSIYRACTMS